MQFPAEKFKAAGMNTTDVAVLFNVTRTTASNWLRGRAVHVMMRPTVTRTAGAVEKAVADKHLPITQQGTVRWSAGARAHAIRGLVEQIARG